MPRDYWKWWWGGFAIVFVAMPITGLLKLEGTPAELVTLVTLLIWVALAAVGWRRSQTAPKNFAFKWSVAALISYVVFAIAILATSGEPEGVMLAAVTVVAVLWGIIWIIGGLAVIIVWLVSKSKTKVNQTSATKNCPYCAEEIQVAAIKCKHCGESLSALAEGDTPDQGQGAAN